MVYGRLYSAARMAKLLEESSVILLIYYAQFRFLLDQIRTLNLVILFLQLTIYLDFQMRQYFVEYHARLLHYTSQ